MEEFKQFSLDSEIESRVGAFCENVASMKRGDSTYMFLLLTRFVKGLLSFPHSSANVERIFSTINIIKTKQHNRCNTETLEGLLHAKNSTKTTTCVNFQIKPEHFNAMNQSMYDLKKNK